MSNEMLVARVRREYRDMPGLRLTMAQACRLWHADTATCETALRSLVSEGVLLCTPDGAFIAAPTLGQRPTPAKAALPVTELRRGA